MPKVCTDRAGREEQRALDAVTPEQAPRRARAVVGHLEGGQHLVRPAAASHGEATAVTAVATR